MSDRPAPAPPPAGVRRPRERYLLLGVFGLVLVYGLANLVYYLQTPLGRAPQLDAAENLALAGQIAAGSLAHEPFYRAMLYPALLALPLKLGVSADDLPAIASTFGLLCHFLLTLAVAQLAARVWPGPRAWLAGPLAAALWGLNPVAIYYALNVLDTIPSLALALWALAWWTRPGDKAGDAIIGGVLLGLAVAARAHFLPLVFISPVLRGWFSWRWNLKLVDAYAWVGALAVLLVLGLVQKGWGGEFAILPTQGPYNFYAANRPGANGRYYTQQNLFTTLAPGQNPARLESALLYAQATGQPATSPEVMNVYWRQQAWQTITACPGLWLKLEAKKLYYLLNDYDQYNNQTFAWHQRQLLLLKINPLSWGVLFLLAAGILAFRGRGLGTMAADFNCPFVAGMMLAFCAYAAGALMFYASGRFRLPLTPLLCVLAGGWMAFPRWSSFFTLRGLGAIAVMVCAGILTYSNNFDAHDESTFIQDELLSANAAAEVGDDFDAGRFAEMAVLQDPARPDARRLAVISHFNYVLATGYDTLSGWQHELAYLKDLPLDDPAISLCAGVTYWKTGDRATAQKIWQDGAAKFGPASAPAKALSAAQAIAGATVSPAPDAQLVAFLRQPSN